jgi:hypothetical protein
MEKTGELGPIYGAELISSLPLGTSGMQQAMPSHQDLCLTREVSRRTVAGYEVLLMHYTAAVEEIQRLQQAVKDQHETITKKFEG